jgi:DNA-binding beta-propeller fold protein YncE
LALDASAGLLFIADAGNNAVRAVSVSGGLTVTIAGNGTAGFVVGPGAASLFRSPSAVALDALSPGAALSSPGASVLVYVADTGNNVVRALNVTVSGAGAGVVVVSSAVVGPSATFSAPAGLAVAPGDGTVYVANAGTGVINALNTATGAVSVLAGGAAGPVDGVGAAAGFPTPVGGLALNAAGTLLYVADTGANSVRVINTTSGAVSTVAGGGGLLGGGVAAGLSNGVGTAALLSAPSAVALDPTGTFLLVTEAGNNDVRMINVVTGAVTSVAGSATGAAGSASGTGTAALLSAPAGVAVSATGAVFVADSGNNAVVSAQRRQSAVGLGRLAHLQAGLPQGLDHKHADQGLVLDHQNAGIGLLGGRHHLLHNAPAPVGYTP